MAIPITFKAQLHEYMLAMHQILIVLGLSYVAIWGRLIMGMLKDNLTMHLMPPEMEAGGLYHAIAAKILPY